MFDMSLPDCFIYIYNKNVPIHFKNNSFLYCEILRVAVHCIALIGGSLFGIVGNVVLYLKQYLFC